MDEIMQLGMSVRVSPTTARGGELGSAYSANEKEIAHDSA